MRLIGDHSRLDWSELRVSTSVESPRERGRQLSMSHGGALRDRWPGGYPCGSPGSKRKRRPTRYFSASRKKDEPATGIFGWGNLLISR